MDRHKHCRYSHQYLGGPIEITLQPLCLYALEGATHSFALARCLIRLFSSICLFISAGFAMTAALTIMRTGRNTPISNFVFLTAASSSLMFLIALYVDVRLTIELAGSGHLTTAITQHVSSIRVIGTSSATVALSMFVLSMGGLGWMISNVIGVITSVLALLTLSTLCYLWIQMNAIAPMLS